MKSRIIVVKAGGVWIIGEKGVKKQNHLIRPLLFRYKKSDTLKSVEVEFSPVDPVQKPTMIKVNPEIEFYANKEIAEEYLSHLEDCYGQ